MIYPEKLHFHLSLLSPFAIFVEDRIRLGIAKLGKLRFHLSLLTPFTIFP